MILYAILTALGFILLLYKLPREWRQKMYQHGWATDLLITGVVFVLFAGTMGGMIVGAVAGLAISLFLPIMARMDKGKSSSPDSTSSDTTTSASFLDSAIDWLSRQWEDFKTWMSTPSPTNDDPNANSPMENAFVITMILIGAVMAVSH